MSIVSPGLVRGAAADGKLDLGVIGCGGRGSVPESVRSTLVTILGRTAAYENRVVTWDEIVKSDERLVPDLSGLKVLTGSGAANRHCGART